MRARVFGLIAAALVLAADQVSKYYVLHGLDLGERGPVEILPVLDLVLVWNHGVTFGMFSGDGIGAWLFAAIATLVVAGLMVWLWRAGRVSIAVAIGAIAGGAVGNVLDRLRHGAVVDFIHAHIGAYSWYVFNVGDAGIVCGVGWLVIDGMLRRDGSEDRKAA